MARRNHYVPQHYLKHFASQGGHLYRYSVLVPRATVREWKKVTAAGVAYHSHLYTRALPDRDSDEVEHWLNRDFETPAEPVIAKVVAGQRLQKADYRLLVRFLASQIVRTPAFLIENLPRWRQEAQKHVDEAPQLLKAKLEEFRRTGVPEPATPPFPNSEYFPSRVKRIPDPDGKSLIVKTEIVVGRAFWIYAMRHILTSTLNILSEHRWVILSADDDLPWFTSDDPVVRLNFSNDSDYDFKGGWGVPKTNIFLPLSPKHLMFTEVGAKQPERGEILPREQAIFLRQVIAQHAHRQIFSATADPSIAALRPRVVDAEAVERERVEWQRWHEEQSEAERGLLADAV